MSNSVRRSFSHCLNSNDETGYVGYSPSLSSVIVAHQGTNTSQMWVGQISLTTLIEHLSSVRQS